MYNIDILTECNDESVRIAIISAVCECLGGRDSRLIINKMRRGKVNSSVWNAISRQENLNNKF